MLVLSKMQDSIISHNVAWSWDHTMNEKFWMRRGVKLSPRESNTSRNNWTGGNQDKVTSSPSYLYAKGQLKYHSKVAILDCSFCWFITFLNKMKSLLWYIGALISYHVDVNN